MHCIRSTSFQAQQLHTCTQLVIVNIRHDSKLACTAGQVVEVTLYTLRCPLCTIKIAMRMHAWLRCSILHSDAQLSLLPNAAAWPNLGQQSHGQPAASKPHKHGTIRCINCNSRMQLPRYGHDTDPYMCKPLSSEHQKSYCV